MLDQKRTTLEGALEAVRGIGWKPGSIIDIGIDKGTKGLYDIWPDVPICLVEPSPRSMERMRKIQQRFSDVRIYNVGASDHNGEVVGIQHPTRSIVAMGNVKPQWGDPSSFPVMTCDAIVADAKLPAPYIYKIDTDTHDRKALAGSSETLSQTDLVIIEVKLYRAHDQLLSPHEVSCFMQERGFVLFDIIGIVYSRKDLLRVMDMIYAREDSELFRLATANSQKKTNAQLERESQTADPAGA